MKTFKLTLRSEKEINDYIEHTCFMRYEKEIMAEILGLVKNGDEEQLAWFSGFGDGFRQILMNVNEYRKSLEFGFNEIAFNQYGWFAAPKFLEYEEIILEESSIRIGRGPNGLWAYALSCSYGVGGHSGPLCVFCKKYGSRDEALSTALTELQKDMLSKKGDSDRCNYHQDVISKTLKAITKAQVGLVQLTLF